MLSCFNNCRVIVEYCVGIELSAQACSPGDGRFGKFFGMNIHCTSVGSQGSTKKNSEFIPFRYEQYFFSQYFSNRKTNDSLQLFFSLLRHCYDATYYIFSLLLKWNVTPLLGDFGGRVGFYIFFTKLYYPVKAPLSRFVPHCSLFSFFL